MLGSRQTRSAVRAFVMVSVLSVAPACASGGEGSGQSPFASSGPPVLPVAGGAAATIDAASASVPSSTAMPDGCADVADALEAASQDEPITSDEDAAGEDAANQDGAGEDAADDNVDQDVDEGGPPSTVVIAPPLPMPGDLVITSDYTGFEKVDRINLAK